MSASTGRPAAQPKSTAVVAAIQRVRRTPGAGLLTLLVIMWIAAAIVVPRFASGENLLNIVRQSSDLIVAAIGVMLVLLIGGIDLSIGSVYGLVSVVVVSAILTTGSPALAVGIALGAGAVVGIINGLVVHFARIPAFITTLGMFYIALAVAQLLSAGESLRVPSDSPFQGLTNARILGIPVMILVALFVAVGMWVLLNHTTFGREIVAVGFNRQAARLSGISVARVVIACFAIAGTLAALGAIMSTTRIQTGEPSLGGFNTTFEVITAAVVGGTSLFGGRGNVLGVVVGALIIRTIGNCITLLNITPLLYQAVMGSLILVALVVEVTRTRLSGGER